MTLFFRRRTATEAVQWDGTNQPPGLCRCTNTDFHVHTAQGQRVIVEPGEWILPESDGSGHYPVAAGLFEKLYEAEDARCQREDCRKDYDGMREFQAKFIKADQEREAASYQLKLIQEARDASDKKRRPSAKKKAPASRRAKQEGR